jgi:hypothetical protein
MTNSYTAADTDQNPLPSIVAMAITIARTVANALDRNWQEFLIENVRLAATFAFG